MSGVSQEQVARLLAQAQAQLDHVPLEKRPVAVAALSALSAHAEDIARVGDIAAIRALAWWSVVDPFGEPPPRIVGRAAALAAITAAGDALQDAEDDYRAAMERLKRTAMDVGMTAIKIAVPLLLAAL